MGICASRNAPTAEVWQKNDTDHQSDISLCQRPVTGWPVVARAKGHYVYLENGEKKLDACGGAAVACIGHRHIGVITAVLRQMWKISYTSWAHFDNQATRDLSSWLIRSTGGIMTKAYIMCSGSEVVEGALKLAVEYFRWIGEPQRVNFISRNESYHGITVGSLSLSGHVFRRAPFEAILLAQRHAISSCNPYRQRMEAESDEAFVSRKIDELIQKFVELGPDTVAAVIIEPVVGAALGCAAAVPGYLKAVQQVCHKFGALLILDEVMCGLGRTGGLHAWQGEDVSPDLLTLGKGLAGGYQPASALLVGEKIATFMEDNGKIFTHGHTYQNHPVVSAAALKVQQIIEQKGLLANVVAQGQLLELLLKQNLAKHPNVGDIRGKGLFWAIEFVRDRATKESFDQDMQVALMVQKAAQRPPYNVLIYHGQGCAGGGKGDHVMIMPAYDVSASLIRQIVKGVVSAIETVFKELDRAA